MRYDFWQTERELATVDAETGLKILRKDEPRVTVSIWRPKGTKPFAHYRFSSIERREAFIARAIENAKAQSEYVRKNRLARQGTPEQWATIVPGMVWRTSWGYDQTNIEFYETIAVKGKHVIVREIKQLSDPAGFMSERVRPAFGFYCGEPERHLVQWCGDRPSITFESYRHAWPWEGGAALATHYA